MATASTASGTGTPSRAFGYRFSPHFRAEIEGGYRHGSLRSTNDFLTPTDEDVDICSAGTTDPNCGGDNGSINAWTGMVNGIIDLFPNWRVTPSSAAAWAWSTPSSTSTAC